MGKVLIIDDSESSRAQMEMLVSQLDKEVVCVENGMDALRLLKNDEVFDLIITDIFMPEMDGVETIEKIIEMQPQAKVIAVSAGGMGMSGGEMLMIAEGLGARAVLNKPFEGELFKTKVSEVLAA